MNPPITVVSQPVYDIGVAAANTLLAHIANRPATPGSLVLPSTLIKRGSVAAPRTLESRLGK
jgi:LacI family transcriptional regulator